MSDGPAEQARPSPMRTGIGAGAACWRLRPVLALTAAALALAGCARTPATADYFPLSPGHRWSYRVSHDVDHDPGASWHEVRTLAPRRRDGGRVFRRLDSLGNEYHFERDATGVRRVAMRNAAELAAAPDAPPRQILRFPLEVGQTWQSPSHPYAIRRLVPFGGNLTSQYTLSLTTTVEATDAVVETPAGRYERCVMIVGRGDLEIYGDARQGFITIPVTHTEWYAPGVGLVKLQREEEVNTELFRGGTIRFELTAFR